jgi:uncharacterized protein with LGFP repeats
VVPEPEVQALKAQVRELQRLAPIPPRVFQNGSISWTSATGAHEVHGPIRAKWESMGWQRSALGYPVKDELGGRRNGRRKPCRLGQTTGAT